MGDDIAKQLAKAQAENAELKLKLKAKKKNSDITDYIKKNLKLYKNLIDFELSNLKEFKNEDGSPRYFRPAGKKKEMTFYHNQFFRDLIEAKLISNPAIDTEDKLNSRRSQAIDQLIKYFGDGRQARPGAGRRAKVVSAAPPKKDIQTTFPDMDQEPKPIVQKKEEPTIGLANIIKHANTGFPKPEAAQVTAPKEHDTNPASPTFVSAPSPDLPKEMTTQQVLDYCRDITNPSASVRQDLIRHLIKDNAPGAHDQAVEELRKILGCSIPTIQKDLEVINQPD